MITIAQQIISAAECARRLALDVPVTRRIRTTFSCVGRSTGLRARVLELLPASEDDAISHGDMAKLLEDFPHAYSGISSSLANLVKTGEAKHVGIKGAYKYYRSGS